MTPPPSPPPLSPRLQAGRLLLLLVCVCVCVCVRARARTFVYVVCVICFLSLQRPKKLYKCLQTTSIRRGRHQKLYRRGRHQKLYTCIQVRGRPQAPAAAGSSGASRTMKGHGHEEE